MSKAHTHKGGGGGGGNNISGHIGHIPCSAGLIRLKFNDGECDHLLVGVSICGLHINGNSLIGPAK